MIDHYIKKLQACLWASLFSLYNKEDANQHLPFLGIWVKKRARKMRARSVFWDYFAYSTARLSRITWILI